MTDAPPLSGSAPSALVDAPIGRTLLVFSLPTLGSNVLQSLNGTVNAIWIGGYLGEGALAATSNAHLIMFVMFSAAFGFGMAATVLVGQSFGAGDLPGARRAFGAAVGLVAFSSAVTAVGGVLLAPAILRMLSTPPDAFGLALDYLRVIFLGLPPTMLLAVMLMGLRGSGDSITPLWAMGATAAIDAGLNPFLIEGLGPFPKLGIAGSAWASLIANAAVLTGLVTYMDRRDAPLRLRGAELRWLLPDRNMAASIASKGVPIAGQMLVMSLAGLAMTGMVNREGVATAAAYGVVQQLWAYVQMPAMAVGAAVSAMAAQNIGAGRWDRVASITRSGLLIHLLLTGALVVVSVAADRPLLRLFLASDSPVIRIAEHIHVLTTFGFVMFGMSMTYFGVVRANGAVLMPLAILFLAMFPIRLGFAMTLYPIMGIDAVWLSFPLGAAATLAFGHLYYARGAWRRGANVDAPGRPALMQHARATAEPCGGLKPAG